MPAKTESTTNDPVEMKQKDDQDDDEDDDEDYNPELDKEAAAEGEEDDDDDPMDVTPQEASLLLAPAQQRAVDAAFQELFGYTWGTSFQLPRQLRVPSRKLRNKQQQSHKEEDDNSNDKHKQERLLVQILGPARAARILQTGGTIMPIRRRRPQALTQKTAAPVTASTTATSTTRVHRQQQPRYETKLFAGQKIQVAVAPGKSSSSSAATATTAKKTSSIDSVLQQIAGPSKISTVAKTSGDWDAFKAETGIEAELESKAQGKDAYLVKQDFLTRVDNRTFDLERDDRDKERAKRGK